MLLHIGSLSLLAVVATIAIPGVATSQVTATSSHADTAVATLTKQLSDLRAQTDALTKAQTDAQAATTKNLADLAAKVTNKQDLSQAVSQLVSQLVAGSNARLAQLEASTRIAYNNRVGIDAAKFTAGQEILEEIIGNAKSLDFAVQFGSSMTQFAALTDPMNNKAFSDAVASISSGNNLTTANDDRLGSVLSNLKSVPFVSTITTIASLLVSKNAQQDKPKMLSDVTCVTSFAAQGATDVRALQVNLSTLQQHIDSLTNNTIELFGAYISPLNGPKSYPEFQQNTKYNSIQFDTKRKAFFDALLRDSTKAVPNIVPDSLQTMRAMFEAVKPQILRFQALVGEMDGFLTSIDKVLQEGKKSASCTALANEALQIDALVRMNTANRQKLHAAYDFALKPELIRILNLTY